MRPVNAKTRSLFPTSSRRKTLANRFVWSRNSRKRSCADGAVPVGETERYVIGQRTLGMTIDREIGDVYAGGPSRA